jgi:hypothetical protein
MPEELDPDELDDPEPELNEVAAGGDFDVEESDEDDPPPHPASAIATSVSARAAKLRGELSSSVMAYRSICWMG